MTLRQLYTHVMKAITTRPINTEEANRTVMNNSSTTKPSTVHTRSLSNESYLQAPPLFPPPSNLPPPPAPLSARNLGDSRRTMGEMAQQQQPQQQPTSVPYRERLGGYLHPRDMRRLVTPFSNTNEPELMVRRHVMLFNFDPLRAIVLRDRLLVLVPDGADAILMRIEKRLRGGLEELENDVYGDATSSDDTATSVQELDKYETNKIENNPTSQGLSPIHEEKTSLPPSPHSIDLIQKGQDESHEPSNQLQTSTLLDIPTLSMEPSVNQLLNDPQTNANPPQIEESTEVISQSAPYALNDSFQQDSQVPMSLQDQQKVIERTSTLDEDEQIRSMSTDAIEATRSADDGSFIFPVDSSQNEQQDTDLFSASFSLSLSRLQPLEHFAPSSGGRIYEIAEDVPQPDFFPMAEELPNEWEDIDNRLFAELPFELLALDVVLESVVALLLEDAAKLSNKAHTVMKSVYTKDERSKESNHNMEQLRNLKNKVKEMDFRIKGFTRAIDQILNDDEDMALMNLSRLLSHPERFILPVSPDIINEESDEPELILEAYLQQALTASNSLELVSGQITTTEQLIDMKLDTIRNRLLFVNTVLSLIMLFVTAASVVGSFFGMNLYNGLEEDPFAFRRVIVGTLTLCVSLLGFVGLLFWRNSTWLLHS